MATCKTKYSMEPSYDPAVAFPDIYSREMDMKTCTQMFIVVLLITHKTRNNPCFSTDKWLKKLGSFISQNIAQWWKRIHCWYMKRSGWNLQKVMLCEKNPEKLQHVWFHILHSWNDKNCGNGEQIKCCLTKLWQIDRKGYLFLSNYPYIAHISWPPGSYVETYT